jgi:hypothetical protein
MANLSARSVQGGIDGTTHLPRRIRSADRRHPVFGVHGAQERADECLEQRQRQPVADGVQHDETAAGAGHVSDQPNEIALGKMMHHTNRDRDIRPWQRLGHRVAGEYRYRCGGGGRSQVESDDLRTESPANLLKQAAMAAADVEHAANRDWILTQKTQERCRIAEPAMRSVKLPIRPCYRGVGQGSILQKLGIGRTAQAPQFSQPRKPVSVAKTRSEGGATLRNVESGCGYAFGAGVS